MGSITLNWNDVLRNFYKPAFIILVSNSMSEPPCAWRSKEAIDVSQAYRVKPHLLRGHEVLACIILYPLQRPHAARSSFHRYGHRRSPEANSLAQRHTVRRGLLVPTAAPYHSREIFLARSLKCHTLTLSLPPPRRGVSLAASKSWSWTNLQANLARWRKSLSLS